MPATRVHGDARNHFPRIPIHELDATGAMQLRQHVRIHGVDGVIQRLAIRPHIVVVLGLLDPDARLGEEVSPVEMVPMDVRDDDVGDVLGLESDFGDRR